MDPNAGKKKLMNKLGREDAIAALHAEDFERRTTSFYRYVDIVDPDGLRDELYKECNYDDVSIYEYCKKMLNTKDKDYVEILV